MHQEDLHVLFDYCVSNPPYQMDKSTKVNNSAENIFHLFYISGIDFSDKVIMIFPGGRWMQHSPRGSKAADSIYPTVKTIDWYSNEGDSVVFDSVSLTDGVAIVTGTEQPSDSILLNGIRYDMTDRFAVLPLTAIGAHIVSNIDYSHGNITRRKNRRYYYGLRTYFVERNMDKVSNTPRDGYISAYLADEKKGTAKRVRHYYVDSSAVKWNDENRRAFRQWKVVAPDAGISKVPRTMSTYIIDNNTILGESWVIIGSFDSLEEANNFKRYVDSPLVRLLLDESKGGKSRTFGYFVPDLEDYTSSNPHIDWDQPLDPQLYKLFNLTEE